MQKTAEERFNTLARGWLAYPVTSIHSHLPPKSGYRNHIPRLANNLYNRSSAVASPIKKPAHHHRFAPTARCEKTAEERFNMLARGWLAYPVTSMHPHLPPSKKNRPSSSVCTNGAMRKTAEERFNMLARGWLAYPVTSMHPHLPPKSGYRNHIPRLANNLYNRSSAVASPIKKPAHHHRFAPTARCKKPPKSGFIC